MAALVPPASPFGPLSSATSAPDGQGGAIAPAYEGSGPGGGFSPVDLRDAYNLPNTGGAGLTVAVTIAFDNPSAETNLATYRSYYGLPPCTTANGCFKKVNQNGVQGNYPAGDQGWALETSLDLDMVSAVCPECHILLVEADSPYYEDMAAAVDRAAAMGANVISNSWAGEEWPEEATEDVHFNHPGVPTVFASGDWGYGVEYPAASPYAVAVGGTSLSRSGNARGWSESAWSGAGSGCSQYEPKPAWQDDTGCAMRTVADVSAVADTETPVSVYDTYGFSGWVLLGGTSVATPIVSGIEALSPSAFRAAGPKAFWKAGYGPGFFDVTDGENGGCARESDSGFAATYLCQGSAGYDGPTGWGTPNGAFSQPVAVTEGATVSAGKATLHGSVLPNGIPTEYLFEYGETISYGNAVPVPNGNAGSGSDYVELTQTVEGLSAETSYHYRITAINTGGTFHGVDRTFGITPPTASTGSASAIGSSTATVKGSVNPRGLTTSYYFEYGETTSYDHKAPAKAEELSGGTASINVSTQLTALNGNTLYHYRLVAKNAAGTTFGTDQTLVTERASWETADMPQPPNSGNGEEAWEVSCLPSEECVAVGSNWSLDLHASATLAERWDGKAWEPMTSANPDGLQEGWQYQRFATLTGVSCPSDTHCVAVGYYKGTSELIKPIAELWDGTTWSLMDPAMPGGAEVATLQSVSCIEPDDCVAVGAYVSGPETVSSMIERWDGTEWTIEPTSDPADAEETRLYGVSCPAANSCVAVGEYVANTTAEKTVALHWDGTTWALKSTPNPGERFVAGLRSVSCTAASACVAAGSYQSGSTLVSLAEHWNGTSWTVKSTPTPYSEGGLSGVSCTTATACTASGWFYNPTSEDHGWRSMVQRWSGGSWSLLEIARLPVPSGWWHENVLTGISCVDPEACNAVGYHLEAPENALASTHAFSEHEVTPPFPAFTSTPSAPLKGESVSFDASGTIDPGHPITNYSWDFGDGATGSGVTPSHVFASAGKHLVKLTVTDDIGRTGSISRLIEVQDLPPTSSFVVETPEPVGGKPVAFDASGSSDPDGTIAAYLWAFGDGGAAVGPKPSHAYAHAGKYTVTLTVVDNDGSTDESSQVLSVGNSPPVGLFAIAPVLPTATDPVSFDGSASTDLDGSVVSYLWDFGDGATGSGVKASHTYAHAGQYTVSLSITDNEGTTSHVSYLLSVANAAPAAAFAIGLSPTAGLPVSFDASGSADPDGSISGYRWDFGDGGKGGGRSTEHVYARAGLYPATLTVTDDSGLTATIRRTISVGQPSNDFRLRGIDHNRRSGGLTLHVWLPAPGTLVARDLGGAFGRSGSPDPRVKAATVLVRSQGSAELRLLPTPRVAELLARRHSIRVAILLRFTPDAGTPAVRMREMVLHMSSGRRG